MKELLEPEEDYEAYQPEGGTPARHISLLQKLDRRRRDGQLRSLPISDIEEIGHHRRSGHPRILIHLNQVHLLGIV